MCRTKVNVGDEWLYVGDADIEEFKNTQESLKLLKNNVPEPYLTVVLALWEESEWLEVDKIELSKQ